MRACLLLVGLLGCRPGTPTPSPSSSSSSSIEPAPAIATPTGTAGCELVLPAAVGAAAAEGPAFVLVDGVGVLRISDGAVRTVLALKDHVASSTVMVVGPGDGLWLSDYAGVRVLAPDGALRVVRGVKDGPRYDNLVVRSPSDVWAVSNDIEWEVVHYDGQRWKAVRRRTDFPGRYDDNKFNRMVVNGEGVWVASWNGVWRGSGGKWEAIVVPAEIEAHADLWVYRDRVILGGIDVHYLREGDAWRALPWPAHGSVLRALADVGVVAAPNVDSPSLSLRAVEGEGCTRVSEAVAGGRIEEFTVDGAGRSWVSTDRGLAVLDVQGRIVARWETGGLPGLTGRIVGIAVAGAGPTQLPAAQAARRYEVVGRLVTYKGDRPLAGLEIELCSSPGPGDSCAGAPFTPTSLKARTGADGSFRFVGVPDGQMHLLVRPPEAVEDCRTPFTLVGKIFTAGRDCPPGPGPCDLGTITQCLPFEMPPR